MQAATIPVQIDGKVPDYNGFFLAYFPQQVQAHPGDTVQFSLVDTGEPHTVTFGTLADAAVQQFDALGPIAGEASPEAQALPPFTVSPTSFEVYQSATQPCYMDSGEVPQEACPQVEQPEFDGQQVMYNSGWLAPESTFSVKLADDLAPGVYRYLCLLHRGSMTGEVTVVDPAAPIQSADEASAAGQGELTTLADSLKPALDGATAMATSEEALAGVLSPDVINAGVAEFLPKEITTTVGSPVTWTIWGPHNIAFNAPESANTIRFESADGSVIANPESIEVAGGPGGMPPTEPMTTTTGTEPMTDTAATEPMTDTAATEAMTNTTATEAMTTTGATEAPTPDPNAPPPPPMVIDGGTWDGQGFRNSGGLLSFPPAMFAFKMSFSEPGTYTYKCLIHPDMEGTVKVQ